MALRRDRNDYESRLRQMFEENDVTDKGYLDTEELNALCQRLQLGQLTENLVQGLHLCGADISKVKVFRDIVVI